MRLRQPGQRFPKPAKQGRKIFHRAAPAQNGVILFHGQSAKLKSFPACDREIIERRDHPVLPLLLRQASGASQRGDAARVRQFVDER